MKTQDIIKERLLFNLSYNFNRYKCIPIATKYRHGISNKNFDKK